MYTLYTKPDCSYCDNLKKLLDYQGIEWNAIEIGRDITRDEFIEQFPDVKKVPYVFDHDDNVIGGYNDTVEMLKNVNSNTN